ncbi:hypothetical protein [Bradyrhizobium sp. Ghvi]|uniref:hypothetical protein n=1 Tax=Bradyrhizobium sp. Ghvi TaxID=1855319 RepID=UPI0011775580|nr:hypothetical protein [Bradyrhizobium sp. Ghvi]
MLDSISARKFNFDPDQLEQKSGKALEEPLLAAAEEAARDARDKERDYDDFDWSSDQSVVLREQRATAVYRNRWNGLVIRQEKSWDEESDPFLVITQENCDVFVDRLCDLLGVPSAGGPTR